MYGSAFARAFSELFVLIVWNILNDFIIASLGAFPMGVEAYHDEK